ncbi:MAG: hypothetical protein AAFN93_17660 [Bacteroidota bacterium]
MLAAKHIELHRSRDFGRKLNATIEFIKQNFKYLFKSMLYIAGPFIILGSLFITQVFSNFMNLTMQASTRSTDPDLEELASLGGYIAIGAIFLLLGTATIISTVYEYMAIYEKKGDHRIEVSEVWAGVKKSFWSMLGTVILYSLILIGCYILLLIPLFVLAAMSPALIFVWFIIVIVVLTYVFTASSLVFIIKSYEKVGFGTAFNRSFQLIKENWWSTFGIIFLTGLIRGVISSIFFIPWYASFIISMIDVSRTGVLQEPSVTMQIFNYITLLLYFVANTLLYCIPLIAIAFQYFNLVETKESKNLMSKIDSFGTTVNEEDEEEHY